MTTEKAVTAPARPRKRASRASSGVKKTFNLNAEAVEAMHELADVRQTTLAEVIRRAVALDKYLHEKSQSGGRILIEDPDKTLKELVIF